VDVVLNNVDLNDYTQDAKRRAMTVPKPLLRNAPVPHR
jgi:hypothetical protein